MRLGRQLRLNVLTVVLVGLLSPTAPFAPTACAVMGTVTVEGVNVPVGAKYNIERFRNGAWSPMLYNVTVNGGGAWPTFVGGGPGAF